MAEPLSTSAATGTITGLVLLFNLPGVDPSMVLGAFAGAMVFAATIEELSPLRKLSLFIASFIGGLLLATPVCQLMTIVLPVSITSTQAMGALLSSAMMVRLLQPLIRAESGRFLRMWLSKRGEP